MYACSTNTPNRGSVKAAAFDVIRLDDPLKDAKLELQGISIHLNGECAIVYRVEKEENGKADEEDIQ